MAAIIGMLLDGLVNHNPKKGNSINAVGLSSFNLQLWSITLRFYRNVEWSGNVSSTLVPKVLSQTWLSCIRLNCWSTEQNWLLWHPCLLSIVFGNKLERAYGHQVLKPYQPTSRTKLNCQAIRSTWNLYNVISSAIYLLFVSTSINRPQEYDFWTRDELVKPVHYCHC